MPGSTIGLSTSAGLGAPSGPTLQPLCNSASAPHTISPGADTATKARAYASDQPPLEGPCKVLGQPREGHPAPTAFRGRRVRIRKRSMRPNGRVSASKITSRRRLSRVAWIIRACPSGRFPRSGRPARIRPVTSACTITMPALALHCSLILSRWSRFCADPQTRRTGASAGACAAGLPPGFALLPFEGTRSTGSGPRGSCNPGLPSQRCASRARLAASSKTARCRARARRSPRGAHAPRALPPPR